MEPIELRESDFRHRFHNQEERFKEIIRKGFYEFKATSDNRVLVLVTRDAMQQHKAKIHMCLAIIRQNYPSATFIGVSTEFQIDGGYSHRKEPTNTRDKIKNWLKYPDENQYPLVVPEHLAAGFEWPNVMVIHMHDMFRISKDTALRAVGQLVGIELERTNDGRAGPYLPDLPVSPLDRTPRRDDWDDEYSGREAYLRNLIPFGPRISGSP